MAAAGYTEEANRSLSEVLQVRKTNCLSATWIGLIYAALGQLEQAWRWLETAMIEGDPWRVALAVDPRLEFFWNDARFPSLLHGIGLLPPEAHLSSISLSH